MVHIEPDFSTWWAGIRAKAAANRWWLAAVGIAFLLGLAL